MEVRNDTMVNEMLKQQERDNQTILDEPMQRVEVEIPIADMGDVVSKYSCTEVRRVDDVMQLCRFIGSKLYKVEFAIDVKLADVEVYFTLCNDTFKKLGVRVVLH